MKTLAKFLTITIGSALLATVAIAADDTTAPRPGFGPGYGPGWRHEQMAQAIKDGKLPPMAMMRGANHGYGPAGFHGPPIGADGKIDTSKLPAWCPLAEQTPDKTAE